jgi:hypothetical protein
VLGTAKVPLLYAAGVEKRDVKAERYAAFIACGRGIRALSARPLARAVLPVTPLGFVF